MINIFILIMLYFLKQSESQRLPSTIQPKTYNLTIELEENSFRTNHFKGQVSIVFNLLQKTGPNLQINSKDLNFENVQLTASSQTFQKTKISSNLTTEITTISFAEDLPAAEFTLFISYTGNLAENSLGFYKSTHKTRTGHINNLATTQFEPNFARTAFPCFDEPALKATFTVSVIHPKEYYTVLSNTPEAKKEDLPNTFTKVTFQTTPIMSTYLVAFIISKLTCDEKAVDVTFRVCSTPETSNDRKYALQLSTKALKYMEEFTGISYKSMGIEKLDLVAIPDMDAGAMENWGLTTYREKILLWNSEKSTVMDKQRAATTITHEITHMWFGNYVTLKWWSYMFLNEGLTEYFTYFATAEVEREWELDQQFILEDLHIALDHDSLQSASALFSKVTNPQKYVDKFDAVSYLKGASMIRMIRNLIGLKTFQQSLQHYLQTYKFNNTVSEDLWNSFDKFATLPYKVNQFMINWTNKQGYPVLDVNIRGTDVIITQKQFLVKGESDTKWYIPISYTTSHDNNKFENTTPRVWLTPEQKELKLENVIRSETDWIVFNNQQTGFYRIRYGEDLWQRINKVLINSPNTIHVINRAQIVNDLFNFAKASKTEYSKLFDAIRFLGQDTGYYPWYSAFDGFSQILNRIYDPRIKDKLFVYIGDLMNKFYTDLDVGGISHLNSLKQMLGQEWACKTGNKDCIKLAKENFNPFKRGINISPLISSTAYCTALQNSNNPKDDWNFLWNYYKKSFVATEKVQIQLALACVEDKRILEQYLGYIMEGKSDVRQQNIINVFQKILFSNPVGVDVTLGYSINNFKKITNFCKDKNPLFFFLLAKSVKTKSHIIKFTELLKNEKLPKNLLKVANEHLQETENLENQLAKYFHVDRNPAERKQIQFVPVLLIFITARLF